MDRRQAIRTAGLLMAQAAIGGGAARAQDFGKVLEDFGKDILRQQLSPENIQRTLKPHLTGETVPIRTADGWTLVAHRFRPSTGARSHPRSASDRSRSASDRSGAGRLSLILLPLGRWLLLRVSCPTLGFWLSLHRGNWLRPPLVQIASALRHRQHSRMNWIGRGWPRRLVGTGPLRTRAGSGILR